MVLSDRDLKQRLPDIITPYSEARVSPASYDVALGNSFRVFDNHSVSYVDPDDLPDELTREVVLEDGDEITIHPGEFILGATYEVVEVPDDLVCSLMGRSSIGRLGIQIHATAGWADPGFKGVLTMEISNLLRVPVILRPGMRIAQLAFQKLTSVAERPYSGRYQKDFKATESRYGRE